MTKQFIMMIGLPASGKSSMIEALKVSLGGSPFVFSTDNYIELKAQELGVTYSECFMNFIKEAEKSQKAALQEAYAKGDHVIIDRTNLGVNARRKFLCNVPKGYKKTGIFFKPPFQYNEWTELYRRLGSRPGKTIDTISMNMLLLSYTKPELSEGFDELKTYDLYGNLI